MVLLVSSLHMQVSYGKTFIFFPHKGKTCKDVFCIFLHNVKSYSIFEMTKSLNGPSGWPFNDFVISKMQLSEEVY